MIKLKQLIERRYSKAEMIRMGADGYLSNAILQNIPISKIDGREPIPDPQSYKPGKKISQPVEVEYDRENDKYILYSGNHRVRQAEVNGQSHIPAFVEYGFSENVLSERKLNLSKKEDAAEHLIRTAWRFIPPGEDRYNSHQVVLWIDNESELSDLAWKLSQKFYPNDDDSWYKFQDDLERVLVGMEEKRLEIRKRKTASLKDPLYILKKTVVGKNWNSAKKSIVNLLGTGHSMAAPSDEEAESIFNRLYRNAMGETIYDMEAGNQHIGRLNALEMKDNPANPNQTQINIFIRHYAGNRKKIEGKVRVWRGTNNPHAAIRPGDFVTFDRGYAQGYMSGKWKAVVTDTLDAKDLLVHKADTGTSEMVYWPEGHRIKKYEGIIPSLRDFWEQHKFGI